VIQERKRRDEQDQQDARGPTSSLIWLILFILFILFILSKFFSPLTNALVLSRLAREEALSSLLGQQPSTQQPLHLLVILTSRSSAA
jgi:hypothetical protein